LTTVGGGKGLRARVLNSGEGVPVGGDHSRELLQVGKRGGECDGALGLGREGTTGTSGEGRGEHSAVFELG
jgi:hypothetical protein